MAGYNGHFAFQPGFKAGVAITFKDWTKEKKKEGASLRELYVFPQTYLFAYPESHFSHGWTAELGLRSNRIGGNWSSNIGIGFSYLSEFHLISMTTNIGTGEIVSKEREHRSFFVPSVTMGLCRKINDKWGIYGRLNPGVKLSGKYASELILFTEIGVRLTLRQKILDDGKG